MARSKANENSSAPRRTKKVQKGSSASSKEKNFEPQVVDVTPDAPVFIGYVGGVRMPKKK